MRPSGSGVEPFRTTSLSGSGSQHMYAAILTDKFETHAVGLVPASPNMEIHLRLACRRERSRQLSPAFRPPSRIPDTGRLRTCVDLDRSSRRPERALPSRESAAGRRRDCRRDDAPGLVHRGLANARSIRRALECCRSGPVTSGYQAFGAATGCGHKPRQLTPRHEIDVETGAMVEATARYPSSMTLRWREVDSNSQSR